jgi:transposase
VSGHLERFLIGRGERVVRVWTRLMATTRRSALARGKSDSIDALAVARAALAAGLETLPTAALAGRAWPPWLSRLSVSVFSSVAANCS